MARMIVTKARAGMAIALLIAAAVWAAPAARAEKVEKHADTDKADKTAALDPTKLVGTYKLVGGKLAGKDLDEAARQDVYTFTPDTITIRHGDKVLFEIKYTLDTKSTPAHIDMTTIKAPYPNAEGTKAHGIISLDGDNLKLAYDPKGGDRPTSFDSDKAFSYQMRRAADADGHNKGEAHEKAGDHPAGTK
jgi:uncharacterized protein (TIGR03067 family)